MEKSKENKVKASRNVETDRRQVFRSDREDLVISSWRWPGSGQQAQFYTVPQEE
jgi:hypothetical protein